MRRLVSSLLLLGAEAWSMPLAVGRSYACGRACRAVVPPTMAAPDIDWQTGSVVANMAVGRGTSMITVRSEQPLAYQPGHILGFGISHPESGEALKGPYTVTRASSDGTTFDIVFRVIPDGRKTPYMEQLVAGDAVSFGGQFGTPIAEGIAAGATRVVGVSTGAGVGPLLGYAEAALSAPSGPSRVELFCGFRELQDVCCAAELDALAAAHPDRFSWTACLSRPMVCSAVAASPFAGKRASGRVTQAAPPLLRTTAGTHFHLVGNGAFVKEFRDGCLAAGIDESMVTTVSCRDQRYRTPPFPAPAARWIASSQPPGCFTSSGLSRYVCAGDVLQRQGRARC